MTINSYGTVSNLALEAVRDARPRSQAWRAALLLRVCLTSSDTVNEARDVLENLDSESEATIQAALTLLDTLTEQADI